jgi:hypothetical protein
MMDIPVLVSILGWSAISFLYKIKEEILWKSAFAVTTKLLIAELILFLTYLSQYVFYKGVWPT